MDDLKIFQILRDNLKGADPDALIIISKYLASRRITVSSMNIGEGSDGRIRIGNHDDGTKYSVDIGNEKIFIDKNGDFTFSIETKNGFSGISLVYGVTRINHYSDYWGSAYGEILSDDGVTFISYAPEFDFPNNLKLNEQVIYIENFTKDNVEEADKQFSGNVGLYKTGDYSKSYVNAFDSMEITPMSTSETVMEDRWYGSQTDIEPRFLTALTEIHRIYEDMVYAKQQENSNNNGLKR